MQLPEIITELADLNYQAKRLSVKDPEHAEIHHEINEWISEWQTATSPAMPTRTA